MHHFRYTGQKLHCEAVDLAVIAQLQTLGEGQRVALMSAGAYGYTMTSRYNTRSMAGEVPVFGSRFELVNARENFDAVIASEKIPSFFKI